MAGIVAGFEYDIFISYRQKDNKHDHWVTEFVDNLKGELESIFKEEVSIYFDSNPQDGLLETHNVNATLRGKLKSLIFIPIISQTYCDIKSFAWQNEFVVFNKMANEDELGRDIRISGGNIASRIIPVKIHELDNEDKALLENEIGGFIRGIDFIYKEPGVNRPLKPEDDQKKNLNNTVYRNQINKVANAVKEIIYGIKRQGQTKEEVLKEKILRKPDNQKNLSYKIGIASFLVLLLIMLVYFFMIMPSKNSDSVEKSIAVLPFLNLSNDPDQLPFCEGIMEDILNDLQKVKSFTVRPRTSSILYRDTKKTTASIGKELQVNYLVGGSVDNLKIRAYLIDLNEEKQIWSNDYSRDMNQLLSVHNKITKEVASELNEELTPDEKQKIEKKPTENPEAYNYYLQGRYFFLKDFGYGNNSNSIELFEKAISLDPGFALAYSEIGRCYLDQFWHYNNHSEDVLRKSKQAIDKAFEIDPDLPEAHFTLGIYYYWGHLNYKKALEQFDFVLKEQPKNPEVIFYSAAVHRRAGNWEMSKTQFEKAVRLGPGRWDYAEDAAETFDLLRDYERAEELYKTAIILKPDWLITYPLLSTMYLRWNGDISKSKEIIKNAIQNNNNAITDSLIIEAKLLIELYDGNYDNALKEISLLKNDIIQDQHYFRLRYTYQAIIYALQKKSDLSKAYYDSSRILLEKRIIDFPEDQRLYSSLGIAYAGLGLDEKAINAGKKAVKMLPVSREAFRGVYLVEDLALIYVMVGKYDEAINLLNYLLSIPGFLSIKTLELDPRWIPVRNHPEFIKMKESHSGFVGTSE